MLFKKSLAVSSPEMAFKQGIKWAILVKPSTTTKIESKDWDIGRSVMKSIDTKDQSCLRIGGGWTSPYG